VWRSYVILILIVLAWFAVPGRLVSAGGSKRRPPIGLATINSSDVVILEVSSQCRPERGSNSPRTLFPDPVVVTSAAITAA
jgi:hypothetical protein